MSSLRELQQRVYRAVLLDEDVAVDTPSLDCAARVDVYRNNAHVTFRSTLEATYPVLRRLVGEGCFATLAREHMRRSPSRSGDLNDFGAELSQLLQVYYRDTTFAYLADVARLEAAIAAAETAADAPPLDLQALEGVDPADYGSLVLELHPAVRLFASRWPVLRIWRAHQRAAMAQLDLCAGAEHVLVLRRRGQLQVYGIDFGTFAVACSIAEGEPLAEVLEAGLAADAALDARAALVLLAELGAFTGFGLSSDAIVSYRHPQGSWS